MSPAELIARFTAEEPQWRLEALGALVKLGSTAVAPLLEAAQSPLVAVRVHAVQALGKLRDERGLAVVLGALGERENHGAVAISAERALVEWGPGCKAALTYQALFGADSVRPRAVRVLGKLGGSSASLVRLLGDALDTVRLQAAEALAFADPKAALIELPPLLDDRTDFVRHGVAEALVGLGSSLATPLLAQALKDEATQAWAEGLLEVLAEARREGRLQA